MTQSSTKRPVSRAKQERLETRVSRDQKNLFQRAADLQGRSLTDFVLHSVHEAALRTIEETQIIRLSERDSKIFVEALLNPREPAEDLRTAARRYMKRFGGG
jgi:uncharacterized protein (DUF1778 family)